MPTSVTDQLVINNSRYVAGEALHTAQHPGALSIKPSRQVVVLGCMDARLDIEDLLGLQTGEAHIIRNAGGVASEDAIRSLLISHHLPDTKEIIVIQHTRCGMLAFTDELLRSALEGDKEAGAIVSQATARQFVCRSVASSSPAAFHAFRGTPEPLDSPPDSVNHERLVTSVRRAISSIRHHPWIPVEGDDAVSVRGFIYDVDTGQLQEVTS